MQTYALVLKEDSWFTEGEIVEVLGEIKPHRDTVSVGATIKNPKIIGWDLEKKNALFITPETHPEYFL